jgi:hypothetical protein
VLAQRSAGRELLQVFFPGKRGLDESAGRDTVRSEYPEVGSSALDSHNVSLLLPSGSSLQRPPDTDGLLPDRRLRDVRKRFAFLLRCE